jgi:hypothetical protein
MCDLIHKITLLIVIMPHSRLNIRNIICHFPLLLKLGFVAGVVQYSFLCSILNFLFEQFRFPVIYWLNMHLET